MNIMEFLERGIQPNYVGWKDQYKAILYALGIDPEEDHISVISKTSQTVLDFMKAEEAKKSMAILEVTRVVPIIMGHEHERLPVGRATISENGCFTFTLMKPFSDVFSSPSFELLFSSIVRRSATGEETIVC